MWDAIIIGAGPAATSAAITISKVGRSCLVVERQQFPRYRPGETLHPGIEPLLRQLDAWHLIDVPSLTRHHGVTVRTGEETSFTNYGTDGGEMWSGFQIPRAELDASLMKCAKQQGAVLRMPCRVLGVHRKADRVVGIETDQGIESARFVIDAGGGSHFLAKTLRHGITRHSPPLLARFGYVAGNVDSLCEGPLFRIDSQGWTWISLVREGLIHWTRVNIPQHSRQRTDPFVVSDSEDANLESDLPSDLASFKPVGRVRGADVTWRLVRKPAGTGYFIVGDAACVVDPSSSDGVIRAIMSGILAGHLITQVIAKPENEASATALYTRWVTEVFRHEVTRLTEIYDRSFPSWRCR